MYSQCLQDIKQLFRNPTDNGKYRTLSTPAPDILTKNVDSFLLKWDHAHVEGSSILNEKTMREIAAIRVHILKGCLSHIPPKCGTNKNEALHRSIHPIFSRCRMGIPLALALMTATLNFHNIKQACKHQRRQHRIDLEQSVLLGRASHKPSSSAPHSSANQFGIVSKTGNIHVDSWIFASRSAYEERTDFLKLPVELQLCDVLEDVASVEDIRRILQKAYGLYLVSKEMRKASSFSPITSGAHKMIPFMSSVNCIFNTDNSDTEHKSHCERLSNITASWGFHIHRVTGDGNCCFTALALSLQQQQHVYTSECRTFFSDKNLIISGSTVQDIALSLRHLVVQEWIQNSEDYQGYLAPDSDNDTEIPLVIDEAPKFLQPGYFHGPLAYTMVTAISNVLTIPIIVFSSALHHPIIYISPRKCTISAPLYAAYNQHGAGHYDAITFKEMSTSHALPQSGGAPSESHCRCGVNDKKGQQHCTKVEANYTTCIRCPCLKVNQPCVDSCHCKGCANPHGIKPVTTTEHTTLKRSRRKHAWQKHSDQKSSLFARDLQEDLSSGTQTQLEYLVVSEIISHCKHTITDVDASIITSIYSAILEFANAMDVILPLGPKDEQGIGKIISAYEHNRKLFEALCITQLKITNP